MSINWFPGHMHKARKEIAQVMDEIEGAPQRRQHAQGQAVDLQQAQGLEVVLVPLDDGPVLHGGVLDRHELVQGLLGETLAEATQVQYTITGSWDEPVFEAVDVERVEPQVLKLQSDLLTTLLMLLHMHSTEPEVLPHIC